MEDEIDPIFFDKPYLPRHPKKGGERAYALMREAAGAIETRPASRGVVLKKSRGNIWPRSKPWVK